MSAGTIPVFEGSAVRVPPGVMTASVPSSLTKVLPPLKEREPVAFPGREFVRIPFTSLEIEIKVS